MQFLNPNGGGGSSSGALTPTQMAALNNSTALLLPKWRTAVAGVKSGQNNGKLLALGDSTTFGTGSNNSNSGNLRPQSYPTQLAAMLSSSGISAFSNSFSGDGASGESTLFNDFRVTRGSWIQNTGNYTLGGSLFVATNNSLGPFQYLPIYPVDTFVVYYPTLVSGGALFSIDINGSGSIAINPNTGVSGVASQVISAPLGINTINITWTSGTQAFFGTIRAYNSAQSCVDIINAGWPGATSTNLSLNNSNYAPLPTIGVLAPDLTILNCGINEWLTGSSVATYTTNTQAIITECRLSGDVIIVTPNPTASSTTPVATQQPFINAMYALAISNNIPLVDVWSRLSPQANYTSLYWTGNALHPNMKGYADISQAIFNIIGNT